MSNLIINWLDQRNLTARKEAWLATNRAGKSFFANEPNNNIDQFDIPSWVDAKAFYASCLATFGGDARKIIGNTSVPVTARYFVVHDTAGNKEPDTALIDATAKMRGIHLFLGTEKTVFRPHKKPGIENDWHVVGWGTRVGNNRPEEFVQVELSPYSNYSVLSKQKYQEELTIGIDGVIEPGTNFTIRQYDLLAIAYLACSLRKGRLLTITTHREVDFSYSSDAHGDPKDFDFNYFYELIGSCLGLTNLTFGIQQDRAYFHNQVNLDGYMNEFWPYVKKQPGVWAANQYGTPQRYAGDPQHLYVNEQ
jgi:hypothetical protein